MSQLVPCSLCGRHVRTNESLCPFCGGLVRTTLAIGASLALAAAPARADGAHADHAVLRAELVEAAPRPMMVQYGAPPPPPELTQPPPPRVSGKPPEVARPRAAPPPDAAPPPAPEGRRDNDDA